MNIENQIQERAEAGEGLYAVAWSILRLTAAVRELGTGNAATGMGAIEFLATRLGEKIDGLGERIDGATAQVVETLQTF